MLFSLCNLENVLQRNLRRGMIKECIFRASGGTRFKGEGGTPRCNRSAQKNSGYVTDFAQKTCGKWSYSHDISSYGY